jgi:AGZA family xanthine/uracil permease-like MFS transporter
MPLTFSITNGIGAACIAHVVLSIVRGSARDVHPLLYGCAGAFLLHFIAG